MYLALDELVSMVVQIVKESQNFHFLLLLSSVMLLLVLLVVLEAILVTVSVEVPRSQVSAI